MKSLTLSAPLIQYPGISEDNDRLDLFLTIPNLDGEARTTPKTEIDIGFKRLLSFLERALEGIHEGREEALDGYDMARSIWQSRNDLSQVRLFVITDGLARIERIDNKNLNGIEVSSHLWDLRRLYRAVSSGASDETINVDFSKMSGGPLRCIVAQPEDAGYRCLLTAMRADVLVEMYKDFGPKLLERNVRSFLQLRGKVNQSIRRTIIDEPQMFLAFNNGLSVTAAGLEVRDYGDGTAELISADDFQIVNGGQTTGSIFRASRKDSADVSEILVPVKITEILPEGNVEEIAPRISQSANNQNKVNMADFSSNHPFHRRMEELSRSIRAPPAPGLQRQSRWFYERARGQYHDALAQNRTPAQRKAFEAIHPRRQMITKTDIAKFEHTWSQLPHIVSRGAQKCYLDFMDVVDKRGKYLPDELFFKLLVSRAIMFRETERIVSRRKFGGYRANIVTYTLAWTPTVDSYLGRVTKAQILVAVREAKGDKDADRIAGFKKPDMVEAAEELLAGTGWLPQPLRTAPLVDQPDDPEFEIVDDGEVEPQAQNDDAEDDPLPLEAAE
ncbi:abortive phage infection protein [Rhodophyticola sp. CCM32]|uniref:AIPR family protein n=1 Tax=Rhodophyticola sp. CCM32 TaxID=2916397 RepID=UPI00107F7D8B|nr:AIPR family protein [Rhodophyticola sp. CCM32]QBY00444.1 abortive phage infection protein [Rhodophyticola sp. CCM32]